MVTKLGSVRSEFPQCSPFARIHGTLSRWVIRKMRALAGLIEGHDRSSYCFDRFRANPGGCRESDVGEGCGDAAVRPAPLPRGRGPRDREVSRRGVRLVKEASYLPYATLSR